MVKLKISCRRKSQLVVLGQVVTNQCCGLVVIFFGFISHLIGRETTLNIPEIFSGVHGFTGKTVSYLGPFKSNWFTADDTVKPIRVILKQSEE